jgi:hypothetical protein
MPRNHKITLRTGTTVPSGVDFDIGEPAWDTTAKKLYIKAGDNTMAEIGAGGAALSALAPVLRMYSLLLREKSQQTMLAKIRLYFGTTAQVS